MERISGNSGNDDKYMVIAKNGNVALGLYLKARRDHNRGGHLYTIAGRLRAAAAPGCEATADEVNDAFKGLPFEKFAGDGHLVRASCSVAILTSQLERQGLPEALDKIGIGPKMFLWLAAFISTELFTVTVDQLHEAIKAEIDVQSAEELAGLALAQRIANTDVEFMGDVQVVCETLTASLNEAQEVYTTAVAIAKSDADISAGALVEAFEANHPEFSFYMEETGTQEFDLQSLLYDSFGEDDEETDEDPVYDA
jgi:hypothetical protein